MHGFKPTMCTLSQAIECFVSRRPIEHSIQQNPAAAVDARCLNDNAVLRYA